MGTIFNMPYETLPQKLQILQKHRLALWDIIGSCERKNSSDANLKNIQPNDIPTLLQNYPNIEIIAFTGKKAFKLYSRHFANLAIKTILLPSPSPAYAAMRFDEKKVIYAKLLKD